MIGDCLARAPHPAGTTTHNADPQGVAALHGRAPERRAISSLLARARQAGGVLLVEGEPGAGKSALLRDAADQAAARGFTLAAGAGDRLGQAIPLRAHLERQACAGPVLVCLDDVQWLGAATLTVLRALPAELRHRPVAWVLARSTASRGDPAHLFRLLERDGAVRTSLMPLANDAVTALLTDAFGAPPGPALLRLAAGAAGNPELLAELVTGLRDEGTVLVTGERAVLSAARLPRRMRHVARRRLNALGDQARNLTVTAALIGPSFRLEDAAEMLGSTPAMLLPVIEEIMAAGIMTGAGEAFSFRHPLLRRAVRAAVAPPVRRVLHGRYGRLLLTRDGPAELAAGHLLRAAHRDSPASLADLDAATALALPSAPRAAARLAVRALELTPRATPDAPSRAAAAAEALAAAGLLDEAARIARHTLSGPVPGLTEARLRCTLSSVLCSRGRPRDAAAEAAAVLTHPQLPDELSNRAIIAHLQAVAGSRGEMPGVLITPVLDAREKFDSRTVAAALAARAAVSLDQGRAGEAVDLLRDAAREENRPSPDARHAQPLLALAAALVDLRRLDEAWEILRAMDNQALRHIPAQAALFLIRARIHLANGHLAEAATAGDEALAAAEALGAHGYSAAAHCLLSVIALRRGDMTTAALHVASDSIPVPHAAETYARAEMTMARARLSAERDGPSVALAHVRAFCADLGEHRGLLLGDPGTAPWLTRTALAAGQPEIAGAVARAAAALAADNVGYPALDAAAAHSRGLADQSAASLAEAAGQHPDPWARASAAEDLGASHARRGDADHAIRRFTEAIEGYQAVGAELDTVRVRRRLRRLGVRYRRLARPAATPAVGWDSLTGTEQAVAGLVAQGLSNRDVAGRMYLSVHTVAFYLNQVFRKLAIGSRVELTRLVVQRNGQVGARLDYQL